MDSTEKKFVLCLGIRVLVIKFPRLGFSIIINGDNFIKVGFFGSKENYLKYIVPLESEELVFYKSNKTDRWWIEIPFISSQNNKLKRNTLLPCSYEEYLEACNQELPERWWKVQRKNIV